MKITRVRSFLHQTEKPCTRPYIFLWPPLLLRISKSSFLDDIPKSRSHLSLSLSRSRESRAVLGGEQAERGRRWRRRGRPRTDRGTWRSRRSEGGMGVSAGCSWADPRPDGWIFRCLPSFIREGRRRRSRQPRARGGTTPRRGGGGGWPSTGSTPPKASSRPP